MVSLEEFENSFELLQDWDQRYEYLIELGEQLPVMPEQTKTEANRVKACLSKVWIDVSQRDGRLYFTGDSDSSVTKGILAVLINLCDGLGARRIRDSDMDEIFRRLKLYDHLSPNRHVGVYAMFELIKDKASATETKTRVA